MYIVNLWALYRQVMFVFSDLIFTRRW